MHCVLARLFLLLLLAATPAPATAAPGPDDAPGARLTVVGAIRQALVSDDSLAALTRRVAQLRTSAGLTGTPPPLSVRISATAGEPPDDANLLSQTLELGGQPSLRKTAALAELGAAQGELRQRVLALSWQTASAYAALLTARETLALAREELAAQDTLLRMTRRRYETGDVPQMQLVRMEREHDRAARAHSRAEREETIARHVLERLVTRGRLRVIETVPPVLPEAPADVTPVVEEALRARPDLASLRAELSARQADARLAGTGRAPFLELQVRQTRWNNPATQVGANVSLNWPIVDWGQVRAQAAQAAARVEEVTARLATRTREAEAEVREAHARWSRIARERRDLESGELQRALRLTSMVERGYNAGLVTQLEVLEARTALRDVRLEAVRLRGQELSAAWDLLRARGCSRPEDYDAGPTSPPGGTR